jgi:hypothetical protein
MGKLKDLREQHDQMEFDDPRRAEIEKEINRIEQWCIDNNKGFVTKLTVFGKENGGGNNNYPWHCGFVNLRDIKMVGSLNGTGINYNNDGSVHVCSLCINT